MVSWLPLYHDMGLVGFLAIPMTTGVALVQAAPQDFLAHPGHWMQWMSDQRGTVTAGPNFSWVLATRALRRMNGPRPVADAHRAVRRRAGRPGRRRVVRARPPQPFGFRPGAVFPAFGMAEVAIGGSFPPPMRGLVCDTVDREALERERVARPMQVVDPDDEALLVRRLPLLGRAGARPRVAHRRSRDARDARRSATSASCSSAARR